MIEYKPILCSELVYPLAPRLKEKDVWRKAARLDETCFPTEAGREIYRRWAADGFHLISWPDGTRAAVRGAPGLTKRQGALVYAAARSALERNAEALLGSTGGRA